MRAAPAKCRPRGGDQREGEQTRRESRGKAEAMKRSIKPTVQATFAVADGRALRMDLSPLEAKAMREAMREKGVSVIDLPGARFLRVEMNPQSQTVRLECQGCGSRYAGKIDEHMVGMVHAADCWALARILATKERASAAGMWGPKVEALWRSA